jgi:ABC-type transport system substrate-binding protein
LAAAGFPGGQGFPSITLAYPYADFEQAAQELARQWQSNLGIMAKLELLRHWWPMEAIPEVTFNPWALDYPDPDGIMRTLPLYDQLQRGGWGNARFGELVRDAARTPDRAKRMAMYREADRIWVAEESVVCPLSYNLAWFHYAKSWVKGFTISPLGHQNFRTITIEPH